MVTFGIDISHHQDLSLDLAQCKREGIDFVFLKSSEGSNFLDDKFVANLAEALRAGLLPAAYHYVRSNASAAAQVANVARIVPKSVPVIPDVEANSGGVALTREFVDRLRAAGYRVPLTYLPKWYWQQIGSPSLADLPPLWSSRYPDNVVGLLAAEWSHVPASYWNGYGGLGVAVLQFTSSVRIAGHQPIDANAYKGTREQLSEFLGFGSPRTASPQPIATIMEDDEMAKYSLVKGDNKAKMPAPHQTSSWGDAVFLMESTAEGRTRRHVDGEEYKALTEGGMKVTQLPQTWVDKVSCPLGLFWWENAGGGPVTGEPTK